MNDYLVELGQIKAAKKIVSTIGVPVPQKLQRVKGPWNEGFFRGKAHFISGSGTWHPVVARALMAKDAQVFVPKKDALLAEHYKGISGLEGLEGIAPAKKCHALIYDGTGLKDPAELTHLYSFFHDHIKKLAPNGRIIVLGRGVSQGDSFARGATQNALAGVVRSMAKEVGRKGASGHLINIEDSEEAAKRVESLLLFLLSPRSAFVSGQVFEVTSRVKNGMDQALTGSLKGKVALVTGAARGIGAATASALALEGASVVCLDRQEDEKALSEVALKVAGKVLLQDITKKDAAQNIQAFLMEHFGGVDVVVHNAGITRDKTLGNMDKDKWTSTIDVNLSAVLQITETLLEKGLRDHGRVICLSSIAGIAGNFGQTNYAAAKSGIIGFVKVASEKLADRGISVNAVAPGFIETRLTAAIPFFTREAARRLSNVSQGGLPEDIAQTIAYLASGASLGLSGSVVRVCGGSLIGA